MGGRKGRGEESGRVKCQCVWGAGVQRMILPQQQEGAQLCVCTKRGWGAGGGGECQFCVGGVQRSERDPATKAGVSHSGRVLSPAHVHTCAARKSNKLLMHSTQGEGEGHTHTYRDDEGEGAGEKDTQANVMPCRERGCGWGWGQTPHLSGSHCGGSHIRMSL